MAYGTLFGSRKGRAVHLKTFLKDAPVRPKPWTKLITLCIRFIFLKVNAFFKNKSKDENKKGTSVKLIPPNTLSMWFSCMLDIDKLQEQH